MRLVLDRGLFLGLIVSFGLANAAQALEGLDDPSSRLHARCESDQDCSPPQLRCFSYVTIPHLGTVVKTCEQPCTNELSCLPADASLCLRTYLHLKLTDPNPPCECPSGTSFLGCSPSLHEGNYCGIPRIFVSYGKPMCAP
jgi:hypothetical protein